MGAMLDGVIGWLEGLSQSIPLDIFVFFGALVEEVIAPIPSPFVMTLSGSIATAQGLGILSLFWFATLGAVGKTIGSYFIYYISDKLEDIIIPKYGKFFGVTHKDIESIGARLDSGKKESVLIFAFRALPIMSSAVVSVVCGILKVNLKSYIIYTFLGSIVRNLVFLYIGYVGLESYHSLMTGIDKTETIIKIIIALGFAGFVGWGYFKRRKD